MATSCSGESHADPGPLIAWATRWSLHHRVGQAKGSIGHNPGLIWEQECVVHVLTGSICCAHFWSRTMLISHRMCLHGVFVASPRSELHIIFCLLPAQTMGPQIVENILRLRAAQFEECPQIDGSSHFTTSLSPHFREPPLQPSP